MRGLYLLHPQLQLFTVCLFQLLFNAKRPFQITLDESSILELWEKVNFMSLGTRKNCVAVQYNLNQTFTLSSSGVHIHAKHWTQYSWNQRSEKEISILYHNLGAITISIQLKKQFTVYTDLTSYHSIQKDKIRLWHLLILLTND